MATVSSLYRDNEGVVFTWVPGDTSNTTSSKSFAPVEKVQTLNLPATVCSLSENRVNSALLLISKLLALVP